MNIPLERLKSKLKNLERRFVKHKAIDLHDWCENNVFNLSENETELTIKSGYRSSHPIFIRKKGSDLAVFRQVFIDEEYARVIKFISKHIKHPKLIIDCGANIGLTAIKLAQSFASAEILAIEPDIQNFLQLQKNTGTLPQIKALNNAVWSHPCQITITDSFRDGLDWSKHTIPSINGQITALPISDFIQPNEHTQIDFLKIDVEGAEKELFKDLTTSSFLERTKILALEIHDEFDCRQDIYRILKAYNFVFFNDVELTICVNKNLV